MMRLDHNRAMAQLAAKTGVTVTDITKMTIWGNHSATQYPDLFHATVAGRPRMSSSATSAGTRTPSSPPCQARRGRHRGPRRQLGARVGRERGHRPHARLDARHGRRRLGLDGCSDGSYGMPEGLISSFP